MPWRRNWQPTPVSLPGKSHGQRSLAGYRPWGRKDSDTDRVTQQQRQEKREGQMLHSAFQPVGSGGPVASRARWPAGLLLRLPNPAAFPRLVHATWPLPQLLSISQSCLSRKKKIWFSDELESSFFYPLWKSAILQSSQDIFMNIDEDPHFRNLSYILCKNLFYSLDSFCSNVSHLLFLN